MRLLLIEDDFDLGEGIVDALEAARYSVRWERAGEEALYYALEWDWDLIILDRLLPEVDGLEILQQVRAAKETPILMLTALDTIDHRLEGFEHGADDYLGKPFEIRELISRVQALIRRAFGMRQSELQHGELRLLPAAGQAYLGERELELTQAEFQTLEFLLMRKGRVVSRLQMEDLLGDGRDIQQNALDVHMHRLRRKIGHDVIKTRRGLGYLIPL